MNCAFFIVGPTFTASRFIGCDSYNSPAFYKNGDMYCRIKAGFTTRYVREKVVEVGSRIGGHEEGTIRGAVDAPSFLRGLGVIRNVHDGIVFEYSRSASEALLNGKTLLHTLDHLSFEVLFDHLA